MVGEVIVGIAMAIGLVGVIVPVIPGLMMIGALGILWAFAEGTGTAWAVAIAMLVVLAIGTVLKYRLPGRALKAQEVPPRTWLLVAVGGVVGFFAVPVIGAAAGVVVGAYVGEWLRFRAPAPAWASTKRLLVGIGKGIAIEFAAGIVAIAVWLVAVLTI